jgi:hypothetical protein
MDAPRPSGGISQQHNHAERDYEQLDTGIILFL